VLAQPEKRMDEKPLAAAPKLSPPIEKPTHLLDKTKSNPVKSTDKPNNIPTIGQSEVKNVSEMLKTGAVIRLNNIYYHFNDAQFRPDATPTLKVLIGLMQKNPEMVIELASHTDSRGTELYNLQLSRQRAGHLAEYLMAYGIDSQRVKPVGYGESRLKNHCASGVDCPEKEHQQNRRTEVRILKINPQVRIETADTQWVKPAISKDSTMKLVAKPVVASKKVVQMPVKNNKMLPPAEPHPVVLPKDSLQNAAKDSTKWVKTGVKVVKNAPDTTKMIVPKKILKQSVPKKTIKTSKVDKSKSQDQKDFEKAFGPEQ
jgi:outer membrane protein OmpA-like peptidoglycan-associated protein